MRPGQLLVPARTPAALILQILVVGLAHAGAALLATELATFHSVPGTTWIPAGVGLAAVLLLGVRVWPGVAIAALVCNLQLGMGIGVAVGVSLANIAGCVIPALLLKRQGWRGERLERLSDVLWLMLLGGVLGPLLSAGIGAVALELAGGHFAVGGLRLWLSWGLGNVAGVFIVTPPLLTWLGPPPATRLRAHPADLVGIGVGLVLLTLLTRGVTPYYALSAFPLVAWAALRLGARGVTLVVLVIVVLVGWSASVSGVPIGASRSVLVTFVSALQLAYVVTGLLLAASSAEREHSRAVALAGEERFTLLASATDDLFYEWDPGAIATGGTRAARPRPGTHPPMCGRLAGGVAHDFNNLLTSVIGHADLALARIRLGSTSHEDVTDDLLEIRAAGDRAAALTHQLLAFSRKQVLEVRVVDLNAIITGIARMLRRTIGEDIELVIRLAPDLAPVRADPTQMEQVLLNLAVNSRDAMPDGGCLTIATTNVELATGPGVRIRVEDTGVGMSEEVRTHLFEPFYTTKDVGKGTGLGLSTAYGIVQQSGGEIAVDSQVGKGSVFLIDLPRGTGVPAVAEPLVLAHAGGGSETVLLVEDDEAVRTLTRRVLELQGYAVLPAADGQSALEPSRRHPGKINLLLTDVVMPGLSGPKLADQLMTERPDLRCIFMSGYAASKLEGKHLVPGGSAFLQKPFSAALLFRRVRESQDGSVTSRM